MIFVTGGTGLIGSHLLYNLISGGKTIRALKRKTSDIQQTLKVFSYYCPNPEDLFSKIDWVTGDMLDYFELEKLLDGVNEVYHCAAIVSFDDADRKTIIHNNISGTANLVNAALENGAKKFCHVSSVAALGTGQNGYDIDEQSNWVPSKKTTTYSRSKFFSEAEVWRGIEEGLNAIIVNPSIVIGPGNWDKGSAKIFKVAYNGLNFYTRGVTGFVDVKDVVKAMTLLMEDDNFNKHKNQRFLLNAENWSYQNLFNHIADNLEKPRPRRLANSLLLELAWRTTAIMNSLLKTKIPVTRETASAARAHHTYDGSKITRILDFHYQPVRDSLKQTTGFLKKDMHDVTQNFHKSV